MIRHHPSENKKKFKNLKFKDVTLKIDKNLDLLKTIKQNKFFFGYESMALVIAKICKRETFGIKNNKKDFNTIPVLYFNSYY